MNHLTIAGQLARNGETIRSIVADLSADQARWRPAPSEWSILEVINHLYDEEREDFRTRLDYVLHRPGEDPPPIDPQGWVTARAYNQRDFAQSVQDFLNERAQSVAWLKGLAASDWEQAYAHPSGFRLRAGDLLAAWQAHDLLHLRQLVELRYAWLSHVSAPYKVTYAGDW